MRIDEASLLVYFVTIQKEISGIFSMSLSSSFQTSMHSPVHSGSVNNSSLQSSFLKTRK